MPLRLILSFALTVAILSGCVRVYKLDIQQGNDISVDQLSRVEMGMSQQEVKQILGTPMLEDPFRSNRWDYLYTMKAGAEKQVERRRVSLYFSDAQLDRIDGELSSEMVEASRIDVETLENQGLTRKERRAIKKAEKANQPSFMDRLREIARRLDGDG